MIAIRTAVADRTLCDVSVTASTPQRTVRDICFISTATKSRQPNSSVEVHLVRGSVADTSAVTAANKHTEHHYISVIIINNISIA